MSQVARFDEAGPPVRTAGHPSGRKSGVQAGGENTSDMAKGAELRAERSLRKGSARTVFRLWIRRGGRQGFLPLLPPPLLTGGVSWV